MLTVQDYVHIRSAHAQGESIRSIARRLRHAPKTIRKVLASQTGQPQPYRREEPRACPKLGPFIPFIEQVLKDDASAPPKQRHTAMQIHRRLVSEHGYRGGYDQVRRYVQRHRQQERETFVPLAYLPGRRLECDFGHIHVDYPDGRRMVSVLVATWSYSQALFMMMLPSERTESVLQGMVEALAFFGCVPQELWWDNPKTVAWMIHRGRERSLNPHYAALASHYRFDPRFCMPRKGQEKSDAERSVYALQRRFGTPVPWVRNDADLNAQLRAFCLAEMQRTVAGQSRTIGEGFAEEKSAASPLPAVAFDPCVSRPVVVDKYQTVRVDGHRYSVPRRCAFASVLVKLYPDRVMVVHQGQVVAEHRRVRAGADGDASGAHLPGAGVSLDPLHYLPTLLRKPATLDHAPVFGNWGLPPSFTWLRGRLEQAHGQSSGVRHYIRVLQLLTHHPIERVSRAIDACRQRQALTAEVVAAKAEAMSEAEPIAAASLDPSIVPHVHVLPPDLQRFNQLLSGSDESPPNPPEGDDDDAVNRSGRADAVAA